MTSVASSAGRIVVGVDGSPSSIDALLWAARISVAIGAEIDAVTAWEYPTQYGMSGALMNYRPDEDAGLALAEALRKAFGDQPPSGLRSVVIEGRPAKLLIDLSDGAEMLVVGSRGHGGFAGLLLGSVSAPVAEHANCPVVVIRPPRVPSP